MTSIKVQNKSNHAAVSKTQDPNSIRAKMAGKYCGDWFADVDANKDRQLSRYELDRVKAAKDYLKKGQNSILVRNALKKDAQKVGGFKDNNPNQKVFVKSGMTEYEKKAGPQKNVEDPSSIRARMAGEYCGNWFADVDANKDKKLSRYELTRVKSAQDYLKKGQNSISLSDALKSDAKKVGGFKDKTHNQQLFVKSGIAAYNAEKAKEAKKH